jgi:hypothetical protein
VSTDATPGPAEPEPTEKRGLRKWLGELSKGVKTIGGIAGAIAAVLGVVFLLVPSLRPEATPPEGSATFAKPTIDQPVTFRQYLRRIELPETGVTAERLQQAGVLADVKVTIKGYRGKELPLRWYVLDLGTRDIVYESSRKYFFKTDRSAATVSKAFWIPMPETRGTFKIVFEIWPPNTKRGEPGVVPFDKTESDSFER